MIQHELTQGSAEWHAYRANHDNASDAPAMMGVSPYKTRSELLRERKTGLTADVDSATQRRFDDGHRFEAMARPLAEKIIGEELYPVVGSEGSLSASFDGLTMLEDIAFEHKSLNDDLRAVMVDGCEGDALPMHYQIQMEQQCMVAGCTRVLFMASKWQGDELVEMRHCWYTPNSDLADKIRAGWAQFHADLAAYTPSDTATVVTGKAPSALPALRIEVSGAVTASNLAEFKSTALTAIRSVNRELSTDQDFADAEKAVKWCGDVEGRLEAAKQHALSQTTSIDELFRTMDDISAEARRVRLDLEKLVKARKESIRVEIVDEGRKALRDHIEALNTRLGKAYMPAVPADFAGAIKGKRTVDSIRDAVGTTLANAKIEASAIADRIQINLNTLRDQAKDHAFLFADTSALVLKDSEHVSVLVKSRIAEHQQAEAARLEAERERIRSEEQRRAEAAEAAKAALAAEAQRLADASKNTEAQPDASVIEFKESAATAFTAIKEAEKAGAIAPEVAQRFTNLAASFVAEEAISRAQAPVTLITTMVLGEHLGLEVKGDLITSLGFTSIKQPKPGTYWKESDVPAIRAALIQHITNHRRQPIAA